MKIYRVGGCVRDQLLQRPFHEQDWVVVGATPEALIAKGFQPVGKSFPVFLHPKTHEEYALARRERKVAAGHQGFHFEFDPSVDLETDLFRRDLTINAMAMDDAGHLIDPYGGQQDLKKRVLRHVSNAFVEDPLRVLRVARLYAQLAPFHFQVAEETLVLMRQIVEKGELATLSAERVTEETQKALATSHPQLFFQVLEKVGACRAVFKGLDQGIRLMTTMVELTDQVDIRLASLLYPRPSALKTRAAVQDWATLVHRYHTAILHPESLGVEEILKVLLALDIIRRPERLSVVLIICEGILKATDQTSITSLACWTQWAEHLRRFDVQSALVGVPDQDKACQLYAKRLAYLSQWVG